MTDQHGIRLLVRPNEITLENRMCRIVYEIPDGANVISKCFCLTRNHPIFVGELSSEGGKLDVLTRPHFLVCRVRCPRL